MESDRARQRDGEEGEGGRRENQREKVEMAKNVRGGANEIKKLKENLK